MRYLVTGATGFIGSNLALELERKGHEVLAIHNNFSSSKKNLKNFNGTIIELGLSTLDKVEIPGNIDAVFHIAAQSDPRFENDEMTYYENIKSFENIIEFARRKNARLIYASSASIYGNGQMPAKEDQKKEPFSAYARSKLKMDDMAKELFEDMHIVGLIYFNVFGPGEQHKGRSSSMIYHLRKQMMQDKDPVLFNYGKQRRDHIYIKDVISATILGLDAPSGIYNVGTGNPTTFNELVDILNKVLEKNLTPKYIDNPYDLYQDETIADMTLAESKLGFKSKYSTEDGIREYHKFLLDLEEQSSKES